MFGVLSEGFLFDANYSRATDSPNDRSRLRTARVNRTKEIIVMGFDCSRIEIRCTAYMVLNCTTETSVYKKFLY